MVMMGEIWSHLGSAMATFMFIYAMVKQFFPYNLQGYLEKYFQKLVSFVYPYVEITFDEFSGERMKRSEVYSAIKSYLSGKSSASAKRLKADSMKDSQSRKLYSNNPSDNWYGYKRSKWSNVAFEHPASFDTLAMDSNLKEEIMNDLIKFSNGKDYYARIGKAWKRGYLLYGPPGTGKSTMIAAMANLLDYDVYDLELTAVKDNTELRRLLIDTSNKSIVVIEDIDCSLDLTGQREKKEEKDTNDEKMNPMEKKAKEEEKKDSKVTLSGLLNCIDGLWSACGGERIIVFTTNYVDKLDPALIRRGRMDKHIEMSYCCFDAFKDVAENLMPKSDYDKEETCFNRLIEALKAAKEEAIKKAEEEARAKAEKEENEKQQSIKEEKDKEQSAKQDKDDETSAKEVKENGVAAKQVQENGVIH
ncbi:hypothetical protein COLO4_05316 [Corchorus olitorius]|uniref:AAA+ ATPase domain-containing protein n=1 Tax=Corchorus olitorius TaxID=93759 RepID=A0A1R3KR85_9ROSI|nr:hypothetical protein COLO4_05316 [Corchorus olitorius]